MSGHRGKLIDIEAIAARLQASREALGLNKREFCREAGIGESAYNLYENAKRPLTLVAAMQICERFGLTLDWLYRGDISGLPQRIVARLRFEVTNGFSEYRGAAEREPPELTPRRGIKTPR